MVHLILEVWLLTDKEYYYMYTLPPDNLIDKEYYICSAPYHIVNIYILTDLTWPTLNAEKPSATLNA